MPGVDDRSRADRRFKTPAKNVVIIGPMLAAALVLALAGAVTPTPASPAHYSIETGGNAVSVWGGAFRINGGADWTLDGISAGEGDFAATYRSATIVCHFTVASAKVPAGVNAAELNTQTRERTRAEYDQLAASARHISPLGERTAGTALVMVWDYQDAQGRYRVRNQAALQPVAGGRTVLATKACESDAPLDSSNAAVKGLRAEFDFQSPYWAAP